VRSSAGAASLCKAIDHFVKILTPCERRPITAARALLPFERFVFGFCKVTVGSSLARPPANFADEALLETAKCFFAGTRGTANAS
jgi:hypothetical protein